WLRRVPSGGASLWGEGRPVRWVVQEAAPHAFEGCHHADTEPVEDVARADAGAGERRRRMDRPAGKYDVRGGNRLDRAFRPYLDSADGAVLEDHALEVRVGQDREVGPIAGHGQVGNCGANAEVAELAHGMGTEAGGRG